MTGTIKKPQLRGIHQAKFYPQLAGMLAGCVIIGVSFKVFVMDARKKKYEEFMRTYDNEAALVRMKKHGLLQSHPG